MKIYLVEDVGNSPGLIYACFSDKVAACRFAVDVELQENTAVDVIERSLLTETPIFIGFNQ